MIGQRDHRAVLVPDANHVAIAQDVRKRLVAVIVFPLIEDAIRRFVVWLQRMRMNQDQLPTVLPDLQVKSRNNHLIDDNII